MKKIVKDLIYKRFIKYLYIVQEIIVILLIIFLSFIPIILWAYSFSSLDNLEINRKRFILWILSWIVSVIPILYMDKIKDIFNFSILDLSSNFDLFWTFSWIFNLFLWLLGFNLIFLFSSIIYIFIFKIKKIKYKILFKNLFILFIFSLFVSFSFYFIDYIFYYFPKLNFYIDSSNTFWDITLNSFKLVIFYYIIVWFLEEISKYFNFSGSILEEVSIKKWVLYSIFIALWFSFIENILYLYNIYSINWISFSLLKVYFFRSVFSIILHVFCTSILSYSFLKALLYYKENKTFKYIKLFLYWLFLSVLLHFIFDLFLTIGFSFIIIIYFIVGYLYITSIFYKK